MAASSDLGPGLRWRAPVFRSLDGYQASWLPRDLSAGLLILALAIPLSMGMAEVAGMPPVAGLYSCVFPLVAYALFGSSRQLVVSLDASTAAMLAAAVAPLVGGNDPARYAALAAAVTLVTGVLLVLAGVARLGFLADFLSQPVLLGYQAGLAVLVTVGQLPRLLGIQIEGGSTPEQVVQVARALGDVQLGSLLIGLGCIAVIAALRAWRPSIPGALVAIVGATLASELLDLSARGVEVIGAIPSGFPPIAVPDVSVDDVVRLLPAAAAIALVAAADTIVTSRVFAVRGGYRVDPNRDLIGLGAANLSSGVSGGIATSASAARTAVAESVGSRSQVAGTSAALLMVLVLLLLTRALRNVPVAALAAVVIAAMLRLVEVRPLRRLSRIRPAEFAIAAATAFGVAVIGVLEGVLIAVVLSLVEFVRRSARPNDAILAQGSDRSGYHEARHVADPRFEPGVIVWRFEAPVFYGNADRFRARILQMLQEHPEAEWIVVDASVIPDVDATGAQMLLDLDATLDERGVRLVLADVPDRVHELLDAFGVATALGPGHAYDTIDEALQAFRDRPRG